MTSRRRFRATDLCRALGLACLAACSAGDAGGGGSDRAGAAGSAAPEGWESLGERDGALRLYYQFVDERGAVRFVERLDDVPESWRDRVGFVKLDAPPPLSPRHAEQRRNQRAARGAPAAQPAPGSSEPAAREPEPSATLLFYSADWCPVCRRAKNHLDDLGIDYEERDVDDPDWKRELLARTGSRAIPVFEYQGRILTGFRPDALDRLLNR